MKIIGRIVYLSCDEDAKEILRATETEHKVNIKEN